MAAAFTTPYLPSKSRAEAILLRILPSLTDIAFALPIGLLMFFGPLGMSGLLADGDTGWHIRTGEWILQHHSVPHVDFFSFTRAGSPWFAWEWGWDVAAALIHNAGGLGALVFANVGVLCFISVLMFRLARRHCSSHILALTVTGTCLVGGMLHWLARPHLLSWLFFLLLLHALDHASRGNFRGLKFAPLLMLIWVNVHASFFIGVGMIVIAGAGAMLERRDWRPYALWAAACSAVTFANPYGWHVHEHIFSYLRNTTLMDKIQEFQSPDLHHGTIHFFELMLIAGAGAIVWCALRKRWTDCLFLLIWAHLSLNAARNVPMFLFVGAAPIAAMLVDLARSLMAPDNRALRFVRGLDTEMRPFESAWRLHLSSAALLLFVGISIASGRTGYAASFPSKQFPESALRIIRSAKPSRIFTTDQWGDFLIYHMYPSTRVFVDGRSDFYGGDFIDRCINILEARWDAQAELKRFSADMVVVKPDTPLATLLKSTPDWRTVFDDGSAVVLALRSPARSERVSAVSNNGGKLEAVSGLQVQN